MSEVLLSVSNLDVEIEGKQILHEVNLEIKKGEVHILFGPNGSGKSTLMNTIIGLERYKITNGSICYDGKDITGMLIEERAKLGIGLAFQHPPAISGVTLRKLVSKASNYDNARIEELAKEFNLTDHLDRPLNKEFSGGEMKRAEIMQMIAQNPNFLMLDEPESGVDLVNIEMLTKKVSKFLGRNGEKQSEKSALIISHTGYILNYLDADIGHVIIDGRIIGSSNPRDVLETIKRSGYEECRNCASKRMHSVSPVNCDSVHKEKG